MKPYHFLSFRISKSACKPGFTLMETVIAIVILAILLTGFLAVFTPATQGIKKAISSQQADRLTSTLERELVTLRDNERTEDDGEDGLYATGFDKAFDWIKDSNDEETAILIYQYRADKDEDLRSDGSLAAMDAVEGKPGVDYRIQSTARRLTSDQTQLDLLKEDLEATDGNVFYVKLVQLVQSDSGLTLGTRGVITNPTPLPVRDPVFPQNPDEPEDYSEAVITFAAEFYSVPSKSVNYLTGTAFAEKFDPENTSGNKPVFVRNLAIRR